MVKAGMGDAGPGVLVLAMVKNTPALPRWKDFSVHCFGSKRETRMSWSSLQNELQRFLPELLKGFSAFTMGNLVMIFRGLLIALAIERIGLMLPLPMVAASGEHHDRYVGWKRPFNVLYQAGISTEMFPLLIFIGVGAMIDFSPLLSQPKMVLLGAAGQFGIFGTLILATLLKFPLNQAASIGVIGAIDGPTSIFVATKLAPELLAPIAVAAYSYMSLVPIIQPPLIAYLPLACDAFR
jgi:oxaloacetate decarboxylase beta subunit